LISSLLHLLPFTSPSLAQISCSAAYSQTPSAYVLLSVRDPVSHPYKTTGKIIFLYTLIFRFSDSKLEDKRFQRPIIASILWLQFFINGILIC
jgi:hypothetical protein